jgi:hypothetical protein
MVQPFRRATVRDCEHEQLHRHIASSSSTIDNLRLWTRVHTSSHRFLLDRLLLDGVLVERYVLGRSDTADGLCNSTLVEGNKVNVDVNVGHRINRRPTRA